MLVLVALTGHMAIKGNRQSQPRKAAPSFLPATGFQRSTTPSPMSSLLYIRLLSILSIHGKADLSPFRACSPGLTPSGWAQGVDRGGLLQLAPQLCFSHRITGSPKDGNSLGWAPGLCSCTRAPDSSPTQKICGGDRKLAVVKWDGTTGSPGQGFRHPICLSSPQTCLMLRRFPFHTFLLHSSSSNLFQGTGTFLSYPIAGKVSHGTGLKGRAGFMEQPVQ